MARKALGRGISSLISEEKLHPRTFYRYDSSSAAPAQRAGLEAAEAMTKRSAQAAAARSAQKIEPESTANFRIRIAEDWLDGDSGGIEYARDSKGNSACEVAIPRLALAVASIPMAVLAAALSFGIVHATSGRR